MVRSSDAAIVRVAADLGLQFKPGAVTKHPVMGTIAEFGSATGELRGFSVRLRVGWDPSSASSPVVFRSEIQLLAPSGSTFATVGVGSGPAGRLAHGKDSLTLIPATPRLAASMSYEFFLVTDVVALRAMVNELCALGEHLAQPAATVV